MQELSGPDRELVQAASRRVGRWVALLCAGMVVLGATLFFLALWWKSVSHKALDPRGYYIQVSLDLIDLAVAAAATGIIAVVLSWVAATFFARRATAPLADALRRQHNFVADASHELRTPLAVLDTRVQHLKALTRDDVRLTPIVAELRTDTRQLVDIVDDLLQLATTAPLDGSASLSGALDRVAAELGVVAGNKGIALVIHPVKAQVSVPPTALQRMLTALISNAINHSPQGSAVTVACENNGHETQVRIQDSGAGIQGIDPARVFDRFAKGTGGSDASHGIGLALVHDTITRCGGTVSVTRSDSNGTEFTLVLPREEAR